jgi:hypothetical protein
MYNLNYLHLGFVGTLLWIVIAVWTVVWKGYALWLAAKHNDKRWFVALVIINTLGILEIIYIFGVLNKKWSDVEKAITRVFTHKLK